MGCNFVLNDKVSGGEEVLDAWVARPNRGGDPKILTDRDPDARGRYPYMLVVGDRELEAGAVAVRSHEEGELGAMSATTFADRVRSVYTPDT